MGLMENLTNLAGGAAGNSENSGFLTTVLQVVEKKFGGLGGLIQTFNQSGLGDMVSSWVGKGDNKSISEGELVRGFGKDSIHEISEKTGMPEQGVVSKLTQMLPDFVNKVTPDGVLPRGNIMDMASKFFGK